jgi:hypothetical protein
MNDPQALILVSKGKQPNQPAIRSLFRLGLVVVDDATTMDSTGQHLVVTAITSKGQRFLEVALKQMERRQGAPS